MQIDQKQIRILEKPEYFDVVLSILIGDDYASQIAKRLGKKQPTITEQLNSLEKSGVIEIVKREKSKKFGVNGEVLCEYVYWMVEELKEIRKEGDEYGIFDSEKLKRLDRKAIEETIPCDLIVTFFQYYAVGWIDLAIGGKIKRIDDIVISFFGALSSLSREDEAKVERLRRKFKVVSKNFNLIVDLMAFEALQKEKVAIETMLDMKEEDKKKASNVSHK